MWHYLKHQAGLVGAQFTEAEAWQLFRLAAFAEAIGWTLLIIGIAITTYVTPGNRDAVVIAGQIHGIIFLTYIIAGSVFSLTLKWSVPKTLCALGASVPPYGSLAFEYYAAQARSRQFAQQTYLLNTYWRLTSR